MSDYKNPDISLFKGKFEFIPCNKQWESWANNFIGIDEGYMAFEKDEDAEIYLNTYIRNVA